MLTYLLKLLGNTTSLIARKSEKFIFDILVSFINQHIQKCVIQNKFKNTIQISFFSYRHKKLFCLVNEKYGVFELFCQTI